MIQSYDTPSNPYPSSAAGTAGSTGTAGTGTAGAAGSVGTAAAHPKPTPPSIKPVADAIAQEAAHLNETTQVWLHDQVERAKVGARHLQDEAATFSRKAQDYMRAEPVKVAVIAMIAGAVLAKLLSRRRDDY
jgi:ElaB/YqjD/DUF883 family membrane-anchored ribosome-binding protein